MPRPTPTTTASLLDFAGGKAAEQLRQATEVTSRRRQRRGIRSQTCVTARLPDTATSASSEALFASRVDRAVALKGPRRVIGHRPVDADAGATADSLLVSALVPPATRQACADDLRQHAREMVSKLPSACLDKDGGGHDEARRAQLIRAFQNYQDDGEQNREALQALEEWLMRSGTCCVCIDRIRDEDSIWSCPQCAVPTHLGCIQTWASRLLKFVENQNMKEAEPWCCPNCRKSFPRSAYPKEYLCFCGKERDPRRDPWTLAHSCGDHCDKPLDCGHRCTLLCHPGRCPPCPLAVVAKCHCGATRKTNRCGNSSFSCGALCGKMLACGKHKCPLACHNGQCGPCETKVIAVCPCEKKKKLLKCAVAAEFRCDAVCGALKPCGLHRCEEVCHKPGECPPCPTKRSCACGRTTELVDCRKGTEMRVRCEHTCNKMLDCRKHRCVRRCHDGPCTGCNQVTRKTCRCGAITKDAPCGQDLLCDRKCNNEKNCGRHKCSRRCCDGHCPPCTAPCDRKLDCGVCRCTQVCGHGGFDSLGAELYNCPPCTKQSEVRCFCGNTGIMVPCGLPKKAPPCLEFCRVPSACHHECRLPHKCHSGACPPCSQTCELELPCGHFCRRRCHDSVPEIDVSVASWARRPRDQSVEEAIRILMPVRREQQPCPPCEEEVQRTCVGLHGQAKFQCRECPWFSCKELCGNVLPCGNHTCARACHAVLHRRTLAEFEQMLINGDAGEIKDAATQQEFDAEESGTSMVGKPDDLQVGDANAVLAIPSAEKHGLNEHPPPPPPQECGECALECKRPRPHGCRHRCAWPCHFEPCPPCFEDVSLFCYCGQSLLTYACCEVCSWPDVASTKVENPFLRCPLICHRTHDSCPHMCPLKCHFGPCPPCSRQDIIARCRCGTLRQQLPCSEVWKKGKQLVLTCGESCKTEPDSTPTATELGTENANTELAASPTSASTPSGDLRERRKEKRKKREEEFEEKRQREGEAKLSKARWRRMRILAGVSGVALWLVGLFYMVSMLRQEAIESREEELRGRQWDDAQRNQGGRRAEGRRQGQSSGKNKRSRPTAQKR